MGRSWKIGSAFGIGIYLHWTLLLLPFLVLGNTLLQRNSEEAELDLETCVLLLLLLPAVFVCLILHELGHALAARAFGIGTRDITMYPIGGVARLERMSDRPGEELCIALAGPAVNLLLAGLFLIPLSLLSRLAPDFDFTETGLGKFLTFLLVVNLVLVVFNLLPAFPMDGGRVLRALLALAVGHLRATRIAVAVAGVLAVFMVCLGLGLMPLGNFFRGVNPLLILVAGFVFLMGQRELQLVEWKERQRAEEEQAQAISAIPHAVSLFPLCSSVHVYVWDPVRGVWVLEQQTPPAAPAFFDPPTPSE